jgi:hypothetical protein
MNRINCSMTTSVAVTKMRKIIVATGFPVTAAVAFTTWIWAQTLTRKLGISPHPGGRIVQCALGAHAPGDPQPTGGLPRPALK